MNSGEVGWQGALTPHPLETHTGRFLCNKFLILLPLQSFLNTRLLLLVHHHDGGRRFHDSRDPSTPQLPDSCHRQQSAQPTAQDPRSTSFGALHVTLDSFSQMAEHRERRTQIRPQSSRTNHMLGTERDQRELCEGWHSRNIRRRFRKGRKLAGIQLV